MTKSFGKNLFQNAVAMALTLSLIVPAPAYALVLDTVEEDGVTLSVLTGEVVDEGQLEGMMEIGTQSPVLEEEAQIVGLVEEEESVSIELETEGGWNGPVLSAWAGTVMGPSGKETYYNLDMSGVVEIMRGMGNTDEYWVREDGCKMLGSYIMCAANLDVHPRGSLVESSLGTCIVCDTGGFAYENPYQLDIATTW